MKKEETKMVAKTMTLEEAEQCFKGKVLLDLPEYASCFYMYDKSKRRRCKECDGGRNEECQFYAHYTTELRVKGVRSTRTAFLLDDGDWRMSVVVPKDQAVDFELPVVDKVSDGLMAQIEQLGLKLDKPRFMCCLTWQAMLPVDFDPDFAMEWTFILPCRREEANGLVVCTQRSNINFDSIYEERKKFRGECYRVMAYADSIDKEGRTALDVWNFWYNPKVDALKTSGFQCGPYIEGRVDVDHDVKATVDRVVERLGCGTSARDFLGRSPFCFCLTI